MADKKTIEFQFKDLGGSSKGPDDGPSEDDLRKELEKEGKRLNKLLGKHSRSSFDFADTKEEPPQDNNEEVKNYLEELVTRPSKGKEEEDPFPDPNDDKNSLDSLVEQLDNLSGGAKAWSDAIKGVNKHNVEFAEGLSSAAAKTAFFGAALIGAGALATKVFKETLDAWDKTIQKMTEAVGGFSAEVSAARARFKVQEIEDRIRTANEEGGNIASLENLRSEVATEFRETVRNLIHIFEPLLSAIGIAINLIFKTLNGMLEVVKFIVDLIEFQIELFIDILDYLVGFVPGLSWIIKAAKKYMNSDKNVSTSVIRDFEKTFFGFDDPRFKPEDGDEGNG